MAQDLSALLEMQEATIGFFLHLMIYLYIWRGAYTDYRPFAHDIAWMQLELCIRAVLVTIGIRLTFWLILKFVIKMGDTSAEGFGFLTYSLKDAVILIAILLISFAAITMYGCTFLEKQGSTCYSKTQTIDQGQQDVQMVLIMYLVVYVLVSVVMFNFVGIT